MSYLPPDFARLHIGYGHILRQLPRLRPRSFCPSLVSDAKCSRTIKATQRASCEPVAEDECGGLPLALARFPEAELRDVDCERIHSGIVNWNLIRNSVQKADDEWQFYDRLPKGACADFAEDTDSDFNIVRLRAMDAAAECSLGALAVVSLFLLCTSGCPSSAGANSVAKFESIWRRVVTGSRAVPAYMLGTSGWPVASLLAKWQAHCTGSNEFHNSNCRRDDSIEFSTATDNANKAYLMPLLWRVDGDRGAPERALGVFALQIFNALTAFMSSVGGNVVESREQCAGAVVAKCCLLILFRLLGPPVVSDPLHVPRMSALGATMAEYSLLEMIEGLSWPSFAVLAASKYLTWRTHHIYRLEVPLVEVKRVLEKGARILRERTTERRKGLHWRGTKICEDIRGDMVARRRLWSEVLADMELGALWRQLAAWLLSGEAPEDQNRDRSGHRRGLTARASSPVFMTMGFGFIEGRWLHDFLNRALDVRLQRLIFVTPDRTWLLICERLRQERMADTSILCVRSFNPQSRPYDYNNKAKFYLYPILFALGVDVAWLDLDIFLFKDPSARLLEQAYGWRPRVKDVLVTDHFDEHCMNHGVFMVRASDRSLLWLLRYIEWLHWYPYGHDQNGWDAFLGHSIVDPQLPDNLRTDPGINVSYGVLNTEYEYVTLTGWAGTHYDEALLLHYTTTQGISYADKMKGISNILNATARRHPDDEEGISGKRLDVARWKALHKLRTTIPVLKRPCYEGIHMAMGQFLDNGIYDQLLA